MEMVAMAEMVVMVVIQPFIFPILKTSKTLQLSLKVAEVPLEGEGMLEEGPVFVPTTIGGFATKTEMEKFFIETFNALMEKEVKEVVRVKMGGMAVWDVFLLLKGLHL